MPLTCCFLNSIPQCRLLMGMSPVTEQWVPATLLLVFILNDVGNPGDTSCTQRMEPSLFLAPTLSALQQDSCVRSQTHQTHWKQSPGAGVKAITEGKHVLHFFLLLFFIGPTNVTLYPGPLFLCALAVETFPPHNCSFPLLCLFFT